MPEKRIDKIQETLREYLIRIQGLRKDLYNNDTKPEQIKVNTNGSRS